MVQFACFTHYRVLDLSLRSLAKCPMASTRNTQTAPKCEVFLSFARDTCKSFTAYLNDALVDKGIDTSMDEEELVMGGPMSLELLFNAIETSRMAVVIFSEKYASSTWCLDELAEIVLCWKKGRMTVLPIFYHVEPSDVRHQKGTFGAAFAKHEERFKENRDKVLTWRAALTTLANFSGHHLKDEPESRCIREVVEWISIELNDTIESIYKDKYVGIESRVEEIVNLCIDKASTDDVRIIGIHGMSGIGKTTLAEEVFQRIRCKFQRRSFIRDVKRRDLLDLQQQLLQDMLKFPHISTLRSDEELKTLISQTLSQSKVIIVCDDADERKLERLAEDMDWFGPGSRIIIISEDEDFLRWRSIREKKYVYEVKRLNASDALQLFCREAFGKPDCEKDLLDICNEFVSYVDGHPLALKSFGSSMYNITNIATWKAVLKKLRESAELPNDRIQAALRIRF